MPERAAPTLTPEQVTDLVALIKGVDSVELKLTVPEENRRSAIAALGMDPLDAQIRQVAFFDTPDLTLNAHGVVVRARRVQAKPGDVIVKLRPIVPDDVPAGVRKAPSFGIEVDVMPGGYVCSGTMKAPLDADTVKELFVGGRRLGKLLTDEQRDFYDAHAADGLKPRDLCLLGPITVLKLKFTPADFTRRLVAELWTYPDGSRILELSTKCAPAEAFEAAAETRAFLATRGVDVAGEQQTKTKTALEFFAAELRTSTEAATNSSHTHGAAGPTTLATDHDAGQPGEG